MHHDTIANACANVETWNEDPAVAEHLEWLGEMVIENWARQARFRAAMLKARADAAGERSLERARKQGSAR